MCTPGSRQAAGGEQLSPLCSLKETDSEPGTAPGLRRLLRWGSCPDIGKRCIFCGAPRRRSAWRWRRRHPSARRHVRMRHPPGRQRQNGRRFVRKTAGRLVVGGGSRTEHPEHMPEPLARLGRLPPLGHVSHALGAGSYRRCVVGTVVGSAVSVGRGPQNKCFRRARGKSQPMGYIMMLFCCCCFNRVLPWAKISFSNKNAWAAR